MSAADWIEWNGGPCPVSRNAIVSVRKRDGKQFDRNTAGHWDWWHSNHPADIVAYRIIEQER